LAVEIDAEALINSQEFMNMVWDAVTKLYGEYGASKTGLTLIDYNGEKQFAIIRCTLAAVDMVRASLASITKAGNKPLALHVILVSGTIKSLHKK
jgi:RNase P/RNase MRP subunit POP5